MPKISVIVPVYNTAPYLEKCFNSILTQSIGKEEIELIVVNDGSTDQSQEIIEKFQKENSNIKSFNRENSGQAAARNFGLKKATGQYISFVDSDDTIQNTMLEETYQLAQKENLDIVVFDYTEYYEDGSKIPYEGILGNKEDITKGYILGMAGPCTKIYRREFLEQINFQFLEGYIYEDLAVIPALAAKTNKIGYLAKSMYDYRIRVSSTVQKNKDAAKWMDRLYAIEWMYQEFEKSGKVEQYQEEIEFNYIQHLLHATSLKLLECEKSEKYLREVKDKMKERFPKWSHNRYYKNMPIKYRIMCRLIYQEQYQWIKRLQK